MSETGLPTFEPMSLGLILDRTIQLYARNFMLLVGIAVIPQVMMYLIGYATAAILKGSQVRWLSMAVVLPVNRLLSAVATAAVTLAVSARYLGREISLGLCYRAVFRKLGRLLGAWILAILLVLLAALVVSLAESVVIGILNAIFGSRIIPGFLTISTTFVLLLASFILWLVMFCLITPVIMLEGLPAKQSLKRSRQLTKGARWQILGLCLIYFLVAYGAVFVFAGILMSRAWRGTLRAFSIPLAPQLLAQAGRVLLAPFEGILTAMIYYNQRIRKEGFDLELLAEALGAP